MDDLPLDNVGHLVAEDPASGVLLRICCGACRIFRIIIRRRDACFNEAANFEIMFVPHYWWTT